MLNKEGKVEGKDSSTATFWPQSSAARDIATIVDRCVDRDIMLISCDDL